MLGESQEFNEADHADDYVVWEQCGGRIQLALKGRTFRCAPSKQVLFLVIPSGLLAARNLLSLLLPQPFQPRQQVQVQTL